MGWCTRKVGWIVTVIPVGAQPSRMYSEILHDRHALLSCFFEGRACASRMSRTATPCPNNTCHARDREHPEYHGPPRLVRFAPVSRAFGSRRRFVVAPRWIPAFAGMTRVGLVDRLDPRSNGLG